MWVWLALQLVIWEPVAPPVLHQGFWQTCDGVERVLEHHASGHLLWELHLGPQDEFALYDHQVEHNENETDPHNTKDNLLMPAFRVADVETWRGARQWRIPTLHLWISVVTAGAPPAGCQSFYVRIEQT